MHVQADIMAQMMREQHFERLYESRKTKGITISELSTKTHSGFGARDFVICHHCLAHLPRHVEPQPHELVSEPLFGNIVEFIEGNGGVGATERDAGALDAQDGRVEVFLRGGEGAGYGPSTRYVGDVAAVFLSSVSEC